MYSSKNQSSLFSVPVTTRYSIWQSPMRITFLTTSLNLMIKYTPKMAYELVSMYVAGTDILWSFNIKIPISLLKHIRMLLMI